MRVYVCVLLFVTWLVYLLLANESRVLDFYCFQAAIKTIRAQLLQQKRRIYMHMQYVLVRIITKICKQKYLFVI